MNLALGGASHREAGRGSGGGVGKPTCLGHVRGALAVVGSHDSQAYKSTTLVVNPFLGSVLLPHKSTISVQELDDLDTQCLTIFLDNRLRLLVSVALIIAKYRTDACAQMPAKRLQRLGM
jgi:hypothetical protein